MRHISVWRRGAGAVRPGSAGGRRAEEHQLRLGEVWHSEESRLSTIHRVCSRPIPPTEGPDEGEDETEEAEVTAEQFEEADEVSPSSSQSYLPNSITILIRETFDPLLR